MVGTIGACFNVTEQRKLEAESLEHITEMEVHHRLLEYREKERQGIARDLHDGPVQDLSGLLFNIQFTKDVIKDAAVRLDLERIGGSIKQIIRDLRDMINELRPPSLIRFGVTRAIQLHAEDFMEKHPEIDIELMLRPVDNELRLAEAIDLTVFRIYQEAMTNIARHALATKVSVRFNKLNDYVILEVRDNGKGFSIASGLAEHTQRDHYGLAGMRERADAVGGQFSVISEPGEGTIIHVAIPLSGGIHS
jgi:signal transduction histidine kinase